MDIEIIKIDSIQADPKNHRKTFNDESIRELATNIENFGLQQPIRVRKVSCDTYRIIMGERRFRAFKLLEKDSIPCIVEKNEDNELVVRLKSASENLLRENVNPIEEALGYKQILDEHNLSIKELSSQLGITEDRVKTMTRLLKCHNSTQSAVSQGKITIGHCKQLLRLKGNKELEILERLLEADLSVSELKAIIDEELSIDNPNSDNLNNSDNASPSNSLSSVENSDIPEDLTLPNPLDIDVLQVFTQFWESANILLNSDVTEIDTKQRNKAIPLLKKLVKQLGDK
ncbi:ParB/RepB/Spo0J family partition protein [Geminocystis sp. CENA526]|uniref:ParB/RepB/Spo0J family partition protein n=1 Tax=Geminocystis sp. CENA526 TaxID=1355871 RepID=UPI003D6E3599